MENEKWKPIEGYDGKYEISSRGGYRLPSRLSQRTDLKEQYIIPAKIMKASVSKKTGYHRARLVRDGKQYTYLVHRLVAQHFLDEYDSELQVNHIDGNKDNNDISNLEMVTAKENVQHAVKNGLRGDIKGERNPASLLTEEDVLEIYQSAINAHDIAEEFGVSKNCVWDIRAGRRWASVTGANS